jgi:hypothetical protein
MHYLRGVVQHQQIPQVDDISIQNFTNISVPSIPHSPTARIWLIDGEYSGDDLEIGSYLESLQPPDDMDDPQFRQFRKNALLNFLIRHRYLFK